MPACPWNESRPAVPSQSGESSPPVSAGRAGSSIARELQDNEALDYNPVGFVDDDVTKKGVKIQGIKVLGDTKELPLLISENDVAHVFIAMPSPPGKQIQRIIDERREREVDFRTLPGAGSDGAPPDAVIPHRRRKTDPKM